MPAAMVEAIARAEGKRESDEFEVWPENWGIVTAFMAIATQWRVAGAGLGGLIYLGLDYTGVRNGLESEEIAITPDLWRGIRVMEAAARAEFNRASK